MIKIPVMRAGDKAAVLAAAELFDDAPVLEATAKFLGEPNHHLLVAYEDGEPAGFISGVETTHPDKGTEMLIYELGVEEPFRRRGIATQLVMALRALAVERGCYGMWVLTDDDNEAARATYAKVGGGVEERQVLVSWKFQT